MIRVLMIGKSEATMSHMVAKMGPDFTVTFSENTPNALEGKRGQDFDVVILGRALPSVARQTMHDILLAQNPRLVIVKSLGPIGELVAAQAKEALFEKSGTQPAIRNIAAEKQGVSFALDTQATVQITKITINIFFKATASVVMDTQLEAGEHHAKIARSFLGKTYVTLTFGNETHLVKL